MKCIFLGTGGSVSTARRHNTSLFLESGADRLLIDCNGGCVQRLSAAGIDFENLTQIFLTHEHIDHIAALNNLIHQMWVKGCLYNGPDKRRTATLNIYANAPTIARVRALLAAVSLPDHLYMFPIKLHELPAGGGALKSGTLELEYFPVNHGPTPCFGLAGKGFVFSADTEPVDAVFSRLRAGDVLIHDCNKIDAELNPEHTTWPQLRKTLPTLPNITIYLVHLPPFNAAQETAFKESLRSYEGKVILGEDGMIIDF